MWQRAAVLLRNPKAYSPKQLACALQAAGNNASAGALPDPDGPAAAANGGLLRCCARSSSGDAEDDVFGKKWVAVYDAAGAGLRYCRASSYHANMGNCQVHGWAHVGKVTGGLRKVTENSIRQSYYSREDPDL